MKNTRPKSATVYPQAAVYMTKNANFKIEIDNFCVITWLYRLFFIIIDVHHLNATFDATRGDKDRRLDKNIIEHSIPQ